MAARSSLHRFTSRTAALLAAAALGCAGQPAPAQQGAGDAERPTLTVTGNGEARVPPDRAVVRLGVLAESMEAADAQQQVNRTMRAIVEAVQSRDVPERAIRTEELALYPVYGETAPVPRQGRPAEPRITGYRASSVVSIEVDDLAAVGGVIDAGIEAGANQLQGISFGLQDDSAARADAFRLAVQDARAQAEAIASAMGVRLGGVSSVVAGGSGVGPPMPLMRMAAEDASLVRPGEARVTASVTISYFVTDGARD